MDSKNERTSARAAPKTVLLVDDDPAVREVVGRVLMAEGYVVLHAANGLEALGAAAANPIDLVLLDLNMPGQGGWETFEKLTADNPLLGVIIITARSNQLFTSLGAGVGARVVLAEPPEVRLARLAGRRTDFHYLAPNGKPHRS
jgi:CheY-like chemotaxis protein